MTFIKIDHYRFINAEIIALIERPNGNTLNILTKNGREYHITDGALVASACGKLGI